MFKFVVTIEYTDGTIDKKECFSLHSAADYAAEAWNVAKAEGKIVKEIVVRTKPWL